ncbi:MAG: rod shape-determining protein MreD [Anaerolineae bacterium]|nr:rod shape-determining protein MreD [Anaerolineae bacterium]
MGRYIGIPILIIAALLNATVMVELRIGNGAPDLVLLLVISWALLTEDVREAMFWAVIGGVMQDMFSVAPLGASSLGYVIVAFAADFIFGRVDRGNFLIPPLVALAGTVVQSVSLLAILRLVGYAVPFGIAITMVTIPSMIYNAILIIPVFRLVGRLHQWLTPSRVRLDSIVPPNPRDARRSRNNP